MTTFFGGSFGAENSVYRFTHPIVVSPDEFQRPATISNLLMDHRLAVFGTVIGVAAAGAGWRVMQNRNLNGAQKFMNIRLYAQMAGLIAIGALAGLAAAKQTVPDKQKEQHTGRGNKE